MGELAQLGPRTGHPGVEPRRAVETGNRPRDPYPLQAVTRATPGVRAGSGRGWPGLGLGLLGAAGHSGLLLAPPSTITQQRSNPGQLWDCPPSPGQSIAQHVGGHCPWSLPLASFSVQSLCLFANRLGPEGAGLLPNPRIKIRVRR